MSSKPVIQADSLSKCYQIYNKPHDRLLQMLMRGKKQYFREFWALNNISFTINPGETVGIIGRNGSGKSTLLQIICQTLAATSGSIQHTGRIAALLELGSGFNPEFTGDENIYLNGSILGLTRDEIEQRYDSICAFADIGDYIQQPIKTYSSGMVVRLAFAAAIHVQPDILVIDEALAVGDVAFQQKCLNRIRSMQEQGVTILLVTHSSNTLLEYCDRALYLRKGQLILDGSCREVVKQYADDLVKEEGGQVIDVSTATVETTNEDTEKEANTTADDQVENTQSAQTPPEVPSQASENLPMSIDSVQLLNDQGGICSSLSYGEQITIKIQMHIRRLIEEPCFGIQISSTDGIVLWSVTTQSLDVKIESVNTSIYEFSWKLKANFAGNRYVVAIGIGEIKNGEYKRHCRLDYAGHFDVLAEPHAGFGWLSPKPQFAPPACLEKME